MDATTIAPTGDAAVRLPQSSVRQLARWSVSPGERRADLHGLDRPPSPPQGTWATARVGDRRPGGEAIEGGRGARPEAIVASPRNRAATASVRPAVVVDARRDASPRDAAGPAVTQAEVRAPSRSARTPTGRTVRAGSTSARHVTEPGTPPRVDVPAAAPAAVARGARAAVTQLAGRTVQRATDGVGSPALSSADMDFIVRELERRVLAELDRRGGRYAGSF